MSGFEIVGVILGGLPIVFKIATDYKKGFEPFSKWRNYQAEFRGFVHDVDIERQMFAGLIDRLLQYTDLSNEQKERLLQGNDADGWCRDEVDRALRNRLGDSYDSCRYLLEEMNNDLVVLQTMLCLKDGSVDWVRPGEDKWKYQRKRVAHSFSKKGTETIASLNKNNRRFRDLLDVLDERVAIGKTSQRKPVSLDTTWANIFQCIRRQASSLHAALKNGWKCTCNVPHLASLQLERRSTSDWTSQFVLFFSGAGSAMRLSERRYLVAVRQNKTIEKSLATRPKLGPIQEGYLTKLKSNIECGPTANNQVSFYNEFDFSSKITHSSESKFRSFKRVLKTQNRSTTAEGNPAVVSQTKQKKTVRLDVPAPPLPHSNSAPDLSTSLPPSVTKNSDDVEEAPVLITDLCSTLSKCDQNTSYLGYLCCPEHHSHEFRSLKDGSTAPSKSSLGLVSLDSLLGSTNIRFSRKQRLRLTVVLASSLLQLQTTPWITGTLTKKDIFFGYSEREVLSEQPYIHHSFTPTTKPSTEPITSSSQSTPAQVRHLTRSSLTSLGILLLELCFAAPIEAQHALREPYLVNGHPHNDTNYLTARDWIADIEQEEGEPYMNVVKECFEFEGKPDWNDSGFVAGIHARVIKGLEDILDSLGWGDEPVTAIE